MQMDAVTVVLYAALVGAGSALIGGIVAGIFSLFTIRMNHKADLKKIAYERQIEALREMYESLSNYIFAAKAVRNKLIEYETSKDMHMMQNAVSIWADKSKFV